MGAVKDRENFCEFQKIILHRHIEEVMHSEGIVEWINLSDVFIEKFTLCDVVLFFSSVLQRLPICC